MTKTILITGATSGIGEAVARAYAANSWTVVMVGTRATATGDAQAADLGSNAHYRQCDVSDETAVRRLAESVAADFGGIDVLVNSAGIYRGNGMNDLDALSITDIRAEIDVNFFGTLQVSRLFLPQLIQRRGNIVNISSVSGLAPEVVSIGYAVSKTGVNMLTKIMALELADHGVRVNAVLPGAIDTPMLHAEFGGNATDTNPDFKEWIAASPQRHAGRPGDIARAVQYLADADNDYVTGHLLIVDGGTMTRAL